MAKRGRKTLDEKYPNAYKALSNMRLLQAVYGTTNEQLAKAAGISTRTLYNRRKTPWLFNYKEIGSIAAIWGLSYDEINKELEILGVDES